MIFIHIPKTGGSAIRYAVQVAYGPQAYLTVHPAIGIPAIHPTEQPKIIGGHIPFGFFDNIFHDVQHCVLLRDPVERIISYYYFCKSLSHRHHYQAQSDIFTFMNNTNDPDLDNGIVRQLAAMNPNEFVTHKSLSKAKENLDKCIVGDINNIPDFLSKINVPQNGTPIINKTRNKCFVCDSDKQKIKQTQFYDQELWEYYLKEK